MRTVVTPLFSFPLGDGAVLLPRTPDLLDAYQELLAANQERLARWEPWAVELPTPEATGANVRESARGWLAGEQVPTVIAVAAEGGWQLAGSVGLRINAYRRSADIGYWIDEAHEGRGLVRRAVTALLDHAFGPLGLERVALQTEVANLRSRALATRLGFAEEGVQRGAIAFPAERRDEVTYGILAEEWHRRNG
ncbi:GNAT family protein [Kitasatospora kazusensis]|uniref:GNAT family protein n=1 Tax=Kitasatospora kazusensis TaxID=407974 RepID=A0ABN2Z0P1_9ACTN